MASHSPFRNHTEPSEQHREEARRLEAESPRYPSPSENRYNSPGYWSRRPERLSEYGRWGNAHAHAGEHERYNAEHGQSSWEREPEGWQGNIPRSGEYRPQPMHGVEQGQYAPQSGSYRSVHRTDYGHSGSWGGSAGAMAGSEYGRNYGTHSPSYGIGEGRRPSWQHRWPEEEHHHPERGYRPRSEEGYTWFGEEQTDRLQELDRRMAEKEEFGPGHYGRKSFRGVGPKAYRRSDERIREDISDRLSEDEFLDASGIELLVKDGEVTLNGKVDSRRSKRRAEDICESVSGVQHVQNNLRLRQEAPVKG
jgi:hypothetical protein